MTAIQDYFRTALVIDDRLESDFRRPEPLQSEPLPESPAEPSPDLVVPPKEDETPIYPAELVRAFLAQNIVCSVLELDPETDLVELARQGIRIADLVVFDWLMFGSHAATVEAINAVVEDNRGRLVVIVVFTGAHSLNDIAIRLEDDANFEKIDDFVLTRDDIVALIFGKPGITLTDGENRRTATNYSALPQMICEDLELVFKGLMSRFAFRGINVLRFAKTVNLTRPWPHSCVQQGSALNLPVSNLGLLSRTSLMTTGCAYSPCATVCASVTAEHFP